MLHVGLAAWIIQDGNYGEFEAGREYRFALEFHPHELAEVESGRGPRLSHVGGAVHEALGEVIYRSESAWVVDFGIPAYAEATPPAWARVGTAVSGRVYLGVDPFFYFERLKDEEGMPHLFRHWFLWRILLETTPWIESPRAQAGTYLTRDATRVSFLEVPATDAWNHDGGNAHYMLECDQAPAPTG